MAKKRRRSRHRFESVPSVVPKVARQERSAYHSVFGGEEHRAGVLEQNEVTSDQLDHDALRLSLPQSRGYLVEGGIPEETEQAIISPQNNAEDDPNALNISSIPGIVLNSVSGSPIKNWRVLWALLRSCGNLRFSKEQYQSVRMFAEALMREGAGDWKHIADSGTQRLSRAVSSASYLPHFSTLYKTVKPFVFRSLTVRSSIHFEHVNLRKAGATSRRVSMSGDPVSPVRTVLPSEFAREDVATPHVFEAMRRTSLSYHLGCGMSSKIPRISTTDCVDIIPIVAARDWFYGRPKYIYVDKCDSNVHQSCIAEVGDTIRITLVANGEFNEAFTRCFSREGLNTVVYGLITCIWIVRHAIRKGTDIDEDIKDFNLSGVDRNIRKLFDFFKFTSPMDSISVDIPGIPRPQSQESDEDAVSERAKKAALKELRRKRKQALDERNRQMENIWRNWKKPLLKPGDIVALLSPCLGHSDGNGTLLTDTDKSSRVLLVNRYWTEQEEGSTHTLWIPGGTDTENQEFSEQKDVEDVRPYCKPMIIRPEHSYANCGEISLIETHSNRRGPQNFAPVSSFGRLESGESYCIYRFVLFWDGFEVLDGKDASGEGIYLLCLNLSAHSDRTPNDVRVISVTPPGVKSDTVLRLIVEDIIIGMTEGFTDIDAEGKQRRIFLDLVGFIGDTPALNAFLDVLGHNANACCHLCRFVRRSSRIVGSRFTGKPSEGSRSAFQRGFYQQQAVRDCNPGEQACRMLGIKHLPEGSSLVLHDIRSAIIQAKSRIPTTEEGVPVVPCSLDPYKACFVAPDHLLTSHVRDCINLALQLLPTPESRYTCEGFMIGALQDCNLPTQSHLVNQDKKVLHRMSMSDIYALSLIAHHAFLKSLESSTLSQCPEIAQNKISAALAIVKSASHLVSELWFRPETLL